MTIQIERVTDLDLAFPELEALFRQLHEYHMPIWPRPFLDGWQARWRDHIRLNEDRLILIARDGASSIGFMNACIRRDPSLFEETYGHIDDAFVEADVRRSGIGARLLGRVEQWSRARGAAEVRLGAVVANEIGVGFWLKSGFAPLTYTMSKPLAGVSS